MENEIWNSYGNNTNVAEAVHAQANHKGKQLKFITAIMRLVLIIVIHFN